jgi:hypothetical protein
MNKYQKKFLFYLEWFFRNYGNTWKITDFPNEIIKNINKISPLFKELENNGIIKLSEDELSLTILELPSSFYGVDFFL